MPGAAPAHRRTTLAAIVVVFAAVLAPGATAAPAAGTDLWAVEVGASDPVFKPARLAQLRSGGVNALVVDAGRVGPARRRALARLAKASRLSLVVGSTTCRAASRACWRIVASPAAARAAR